MNEKTQRELADLFDEVVIQVGDDKAFTVPATNNSPVNKYIQAASLNGLPLKKGFYTHVQITQGGTLELVIGEQPNDACFADQERSGD